MRVMSTPGPFSTGSERVPRCMTEMRSLNARISSRSLERSTIAVPAVLRSMSRWRTNWAAPTSSPRVGCNATMMEGWRGELAGQYELLLVSAGQETYLRRCARRPDPVRRNCRFRRAAACFSCRRYRAGKSPACPATPAGSSQPGPSRGPGRRGGGHRKHRQGRASSSAPRRTDRHRDRQRGRNPPRGRRRPRMHSASSFWPLPSTPATPRISPRPRSGSRPSASPGRARRAADPAPPGPAARPRLPASAGAAETAWVSSRPIMSRESSSGTASRASRSATWAPSRSTAIRSAA